MYGGDVTTNLACGKELISFGQERERKNGGGGNRQPLPRGKINGDSPVEEGMSNEDGMVGQGKGLVHYWGKVKRKRNGRTGKAQGGIRSQRCGGIASLKVETYLKYKREANGIDDPVKKKKGWLEGGYTGKDENGTLVLPARKEFLLGGGEIGAIFPNLTT